MHQIFCVLYQNELYWELKVKQKLPPHSSSTQVKFSPSVEQSSSIVQPSAEKKWTILPAQYYLFSL